MIAYHITHSNVEKNQIYELLEPDFSIIDDSMKHVITNNFPEGLSHWGNYLYPKRANFQTSGMSVYETIF